MILPIDLVSTNSNAYMPYLIRVIEANPIVQDMNLDSKNNLASYDVLRN